MYLASQLRRQLASQLASQSYLPKIRYLASQLPSGSQYLLKYFRTFVRKYFRTSVHVYYYYFYFRTTKVLSRVLSYVVPSYSVRSYYVDKCYIRTFVLLIHIYVYSKSIILNYLYLFNGYYLHVRVLYTYSTCRCTTSESQQKDFNKSCYSLSTQEAGLASPTCTRTGRVQLYTYSRHSSCTTKLQRK